jgi:hypothetical protein
MTLVDKLKTYSSSPVANFTKLLQYYKFEENTFHIFYEGDDDKSFYTNYIEEYLKDDYKIYYYNCKNKNGVYENYCKINWSKYTRERILFFVDKDHSEYIKESYTKGSNIFVTKYYSIENYLVNENIIRRIITDLLNIEDEETIQSIVVTFSFQLQKFVQQILIITSWVLYHRMHKNKPNLDNINLSDIFYFSSSLEIKRHPLPKKKKLIAYLDQNAKVNTEPKCWKELLEIYKMLLGINEYKQHLRGKYELWFLIKYINLLPNLLNSDRKKGERKYKYKISICTNNAVSIIAPRLLIPTDLEEFMDNNICRYLH